MNNLFENDSCLIIWENPFLKITIKNFTHDTIENDKFIFSLKKIYTKFYEKKIKFSQIYDISKIKTEKPLKMINYIKNFANFLRTQENIISSNCYSVAIIIKDKNLVKKLLNKFLSGNKTPILLTDNLQNATEWCQEHINKNKISTEYIENLA